MAKANPEMTFKTGFMTWWPTTGAEVTNHRLKAVATVTD
jgi:hypothetical protein